MATWFEITYTGEPTEADWARVAELAAQGCLAGELISDEDVLDEDELMALKGRPGGPVARSAGVGSAPCSGPRAEREQW